jgi:hypothetical protein
VTCIVYGLSSSRNHELRYIGQTTQKLSKRLDSHIHCPKRSRQRYVWRWINKERREGHQIEIVPILTNAVWHESEKLLIAAYRKAGARLVNLTDGGEGVLGRKLSEEGRKKISLAHKGREKSPEHLAKILAVNAARAGKPLSEEHKAKVAAAHKGKRPKNLESLWAKSRGRPWSEKQRAATMAAHAAKKAAKLAANGPRVDLRKNPTPERRAALAAQIRAVTSRPDVRAKISASQVGKKKSAASIAKRTATRRANGSYGLVFIQ